MSDKPQSERELTSIVIAWRKRYSTVLLLNFLFVAFAVIYVILQDGTDFIETDWPYAAGFLLVSAILWSGVIGRCPRCSKSFARRGAYSYPKRCPSCDLDMHLGKDKTSK